jgi:hypothetical protein
MIAIAPGYQDFNGVTGNNVYVAQDTTPASASSVPLQTTSVGTVDDDSTVTTLAYGIPAANNMACTRFRGHSPKLIPPAVRTPLGSCNRS